MYIFCFLYILYVYFLLIIIYKFICVFVIVRYKIFEIGFIVKKVVGVTFCCDGGWILVCI